MTERALLQPVLSRSRHDRAAEHRKDDAWLASAWADGLVLVMTPEQTVPVAEDPAGPRLDWRKSSTVDSSTERIFLGEEGETAYFLVRGERDTKADSWGDLRSVGADLSDLDAGLLVEAVALAHWHDRHTRCPRCGEATEPIEAGWARRCTVDGSDHWPRTDPAVIMLVHDGGDRCVLGRQPSWPEGRFSILAGFVEPGESLEAAVAREVAEEVGLRVTDIQYVASQPWPFPASLMLGYIAKVDGDQTLRLADQELAEAIWVSKDDIRTRTGFEHLPPPVSIARLIIDSWLEGRLPSS